MTNEQLLVIAKRIHGLSSNMVAEGRFVMDNGKNLAFVIADGEPGLELARFFADAEGTIRLLLFEIERLRRDTSANDIAARAIAELDVEREAHRKTAAERDRLKIVYHEIQDAHRKSLEATRPPFGSIGDSKAATPSPALVGTELKSSGPVEYAVVHAEQLDSLAATVNQQIQAGWQPVGGICAENFDAVFKPQPATRYYQAVIR